MLLKLGLKYLTHLCVSNCWTHLFYEKFACMLFNMNCPRVLLISGCLSVGCGTRGNVHYWSKIKYYEEDNAFSIQTQWKTHLKISRCCIRVLIISPCNENVPKHQPPLKKKISQSIKCYKIREWNQLITKVSETLALFESSASNSLELLHQTTGFVDTFLLAEKH